MQVSFSNQNGVETAELKCLQHLRQLRLGSFDFSSDEAVQHRLEQIHHQRDLRFVRSLSQSVDLVMVAHH